MNRYIIEDANRGVFTEWYLNAEHKWKPRFRWSILRTEGRWFLSKNDAERELAKMLPAAPKAYVLELPRSLWNKKPTLLKS